MHTSALFPDFAHGEFNFIYLNCLVCCEDHPDVYTSMNDLAVLRRKQKRYDGTENLFKEVLEGRHHKLDEASTAKSGKFTTQSQLMSSPNITSRSAFQ